MREIYSIIEKIAPTATTVVIDGETGTGKEVVAQAIHSLSPRAKNELVVFDCGAVPPNLIESELLGHEKGRPHRRDDEPRQGLRLSRPTAARCSSTSFRRGRRSTGSPSSLRVLEQREVRRVGSTKASKVDIRVIAATNRNLEDEAGARQVPPGFNVTGSAVVRLHPLSAPRSQRRHPAPGPALPRAPGTTTAPPNGKLAGPHRGARCDGGAAELSVARQRPRAGQRRSSAPCRSATTSVIDREAISSTTFARANAAGTRDATCRSAPRPHLWCR